MPDSAPTTGSPVREALAEAVERLGGQHRPGQVQMADAVARALTEREHLLVQAGTGTGKSLAYLVPAFLHGSRVVVATATLALQHQLVERDIPALLEAAGDRVGEGAGYAVLKGRSNYACLHRVREGVPDDQGSLIDAADVAVGSTGAEVVALRDWVEEQAEAGGTGERDHAPRHTDRAWRQVSVNHRDCLGAARCPFGEECFAELARDRANRASVVVTNHSLLAIDAVEGVPMIPEYDAVVVDEAHELVARVTQAATDELRPVDVERAARRAQRHVGEAGADACAVFQDAAETLRTAVDAADVGRLDALPDDLADALALVRDAARALTSAFPRDAGEQADPGLVQAKGWVQEIFATTERMAADSERDVLWVAQPSRPAGQQRERGGGYLCVAPLEVWAQMRDHMLGEKTVVFTSATLRLGGDFDAVAGSLGFRASERLTHSLDRPDPDAGAVGAASSAPESDDEPPPIRWRGVDVGSPFDYGRQGILYVAKHLPPPGRDGPGQAQLAEIVDLVDAAGGRTLGLFSSRRAAEVAAEAVRTRLPHLTTLAQGEAQLPELRRLFTEDPYTCLFGTLSLWQGLDVPGDTCQLVLIDRIPFPRPDDPLMSARQRAADRAGGNGFMTVAATHAALLLAQGSGRLIRDVTDQGMVAVLDPRLVTARYGSFLAASLPPFWRTTDRTVALEALHRLTAGADPVDDGTPPAPRGRSTRERVGP